MGAGLSGRALVGIRLCRICCGYRRCIDYRSCVCSNGLLSVVSNKSLSKQCFIHCLFRGHYNLTTTWRRKGVVDVCGLPELLWQGPGPQLRGPAGLPAPSRRRSSGSPQTATIPFSFMSCYNLDSRLMWKD